jgi:2-dehydropantoate 2-reductase
VSILIVGAGAAGGYLGARLIAGGRDVTFLVHPPALARLSAQGLRVRHVTGLQTIPVDAVTVSELRGCYDVIVVAVRTNVVSSAINDISQAVAPGTRIVPIMNGISHLSMLTAAFGLEVVLGAAARLATSLRADGTIEEIVPGVQLELGQLDGGRSDALSRTTAELAVDNVAVTVRDDVLAAMWEKFAFITANAVLTCLAGDTIGIIARAPGGRDLARSVLAEVAAAAAADGHALAGSVLAGLEGNLTDPSSTFGPSMLRDMKAGRPIEVTVLRDFHDRARQHTIPTPLLDAALVVIDVHNLRTGA